MSTSDRTTTRPVLVVVGAGIAGIRTIQALRQRGYDTPITLISDQTQLPYNLPPLSKQVLSGDWPAERAHLVSGEDLTRLQVNFIAGDGAVQLDRERCILSLRSGRAITYTILIVATGAQARAWKVPLNGVHTLRTLDDALQLQSALANARTVAAIGSGFIAAEVAATATALGKRVHLIHDGAAPCQDRIGSVTAEWLADVHRRHGVVLHPSCLALHITPGPRGLDIATSLGTTVSADLVVLGIGAQAQLDWLNDTGLATDHGVPVDARGRARGATAEESVYAIGDCAVWPGRMAPNGHWTAAVEQAAIVAASIVGDPERPFAPDYVWSDQFDAKIQVCGLLDPNQQPVWTSSGEDGAVTVYAQQGIVNAVVLANRPRLAAVTRGMLQRTRLLEPILTAITEKL